MRSVNVQCLNVKVFHLFTDIAEPADTPVRLRIVGTVLTDHRTGVAKLIHAMVGLILVLVPYALYFLAILRDLIRVVVSHFSFLFLTILFIIILLTDSPPFLIYGYQPMEL